MIRTTLVKKRGQHTIHYLAYGGMAQVNTPNGIYSIHFVCGAYIENCVVSMKNESWYYVIYVNQHIVNSKSLYKSYTHDYILLLCYQLKN